MLDRRQVFAGLFGALAAMPGEGQRIWFDTSPVWRKGDRSPGALARLKTTAWHTQPGRLYLVRDPLTGVIFSQIRLPGELFAFRALYAEGGRTFDLAQLKAAGCAARGVAMHSYCMAFLHGINGSHRLAYVSPSPALNPLDYPVLREAPPILEGWGHAA